jgi:asparagine synthase (glutamine-hydrolysing)
MEYENVKDNVSDTSELRKALQDSVHRQLMSDVPYGVLLSGGLDSSIISAITKKFAPKRIESDDQQQAWYPQLHSFAVGLVGSPDLAAARKVADHIGSIHHESILQCRKDSMPSAMLSIIWKPMMSRLFVHQHRCIYWPG